MTPEQSHSGLLLAERYQLGDVMAQGAISTIYRGQDNILQRPIVVKAVPPEYIAAYRHALLVTSELTHPAVVATYDALLHEEWFFLVQESVSARPLDLYLGSGIPSERSLDLALQLARALAYAHSHSVTHGDLTPVAVLVDRRAQVHVNNFALPTDVRYFTDVANTLPGAGEDTQESDDSSLNNAPSPSPSGDVRAVGLLLWQMLRAPVAEKSEEVEPPPRRVFRQDVADPVRELVWRCLRPKHPRAITDAESLTLALEAEVHTLSIARAPLSELTPPALRVARAAVAERASWSTEDTQGALQPWPNRVTVGSRSAWQSNQTPGTSTTEWQEPRSKVATEEPIGHPKLRLPSRSDVSPTAYQQPDAMEWLEQDVTQPQGRSVDNASHRRVTKTSATSLGSGTVLLLGASLFLVAFLAGFFLVAMIAGR
ncbi:MAG: protein kinase [Ktedonobacterales bacterium]